MPGIRSVVRSHDPTATFANVQPGASAMVDTIRQLWENTPEQDRPTTTFEQLHERACVMTAASNARKRGVKTFAFSAEEARALGGPGRTPIERRAEPQRMTREVRGACVITRPEPVAEFDARHAAACRAQAEENGRVLAASITAASRAQHAPARVVMDGTRPGFAPNSATAIDVTGVVGPNRTMKAVNYLRATMPGFADASWEDQIETAGRKLASGELVAKGDR